MSSYAWINKFTQELIKELIIIPCALQSVLFCSLGVYLSLVCVCCVKTLLKEDNFNK